MAQKFEINMINISKWKSVFLAKVSAAFSKIKVHSNCEPEMPEDKLFSQIGKLKGFIPDHVIVQIPNVIKKFAINTPLRLAHFLAQCEHESNHWNSVSENLNYSAERLKIIFAKYFPGTIHELYAKNPEKIASRVYASRMGNGDEASKEGWRFRGRGYIQLTGKVNYQAFNMVVEDDLLINPELVETKYPLLSAAWFFEKNGLNEIADKGADNATVFAVTKIVNGGIIGLDDRIKYFNTIHTLLK
jgi:putative chitinase